MQQLQHLALIECLAKVDAIDNQSQWLNVTIIWCNASSSSGHPVTSHAHQDHAYALAVNVYAVTALCLIGFVGNGLTIVVLHSDADRHKNPSNCLLQALAVADILYLTACLFTQPLRTIHQCTDWFEPWARRAFVRVEPYIWALASTAQTITTYTVILVTVDRYVAVCRPLSGAKWRSVARAKIAVALVIALSVAYNVPGFFEFRSDDDSVVDSAAVGCDVLAWNGASATAGDDNLPTFGTAVNKPTKLRSSLTYFVVYKTVCFLVFRCVGPLVTLVVLNAKIILGLRAMRRKRRRMRRGRREGPARSSDRWSLTLMMIAVVTVFIVCALPDLGLRVTITLMEFFPRPIVLVNLRSMLYANTAANALLTFNTAANFLIYCFVCAKFRALLLRLVSCRRLPGRGTAAAAVEAWELRSGLGARV